MQAFHELSELPMAELERLCVEACMHDGAGNPFAGQGTRPENATHTAGEWVTFEAGVRSAASNALGRLRGHAAKEYVSIAGRAAL